MQSPRLPSTADGGLSVAQTPRCALFAAFVIVILSALGIPKGQAAEPPDANSDEGKALQMFDSVYGRKFKEAQKSPSATDDIELAGELIKVAKDSLNNAALVAVLCDRAAELTSMSSPGRPVAVEALDLLLRFAPQRQLQTLERLVEVRQRLYAESSGEQRKDVGDQLLATQLTLAGALRTKGDLDKAVTCYEGAIRTAGLIRSLRLTEIREEYAAARAEQKQQLRISQLREQILGDVHDVQAINELLHILVVERDDPAAAIRYAELSPDDAWKNHVPMATKSLADLNEKDVLSLGDWYASLAAKEEGSAKRSMQSRAKAFYDRYLSINTNNDLLRNRVELAVKAIEARTITKTKLTTIKPVRFKILLQPEPHVSEDRIWAHPDGDNSSVVEYELGGQYKVLAGTAALNNKGPTTCILTFRIVGDGKLLWTSKPLVKAKEPLSEQFNVNINGVKTLQLYVDCKGSPTNAWTTWDNVTLETSGPLTASSSKVETKEDDRLLKALAGTTWKFTTTKELATITFNDDMTVSRSWISGKGKWRTNGPATVKAAILGNPLLEREVTIEFSKDGRECSMSGWDSNHTRLVRVR